MMAEPRQPDRGRLITGILCVVLGFLPVAIALRVIPVSDEQLHAPMWIVALSGVVFIIAGCMIFLANHTWANDLLAGVLCLLFGVAGTWVAFLSPSDGFSGGIPLLSQATNVMLGRGVFGFGAILSFAISVYAFRRAIQSSRYFA